MVGETDEYVLSTLHIPDRMGMVGWSDGWMDGWGMGWDGMGVDIMLDGWMDGWMDKPN